MAVTKTTPPKRTPPKNAANANASVEHMIAKLKADSRKLDKNPSEPAVHRAVTRLVNDIHEIRSHTPKTVRVSIMKRIGRMIASEAYRNVLLVALAAGHATSISSILNYVEGVLLFAAGPPNWASSVASLLAAAIMGMLGRSIQKFSWSRLKKHNSTMRRRLKINKTFARR